MGSNSKPRKKYKPKPCVKPLGIRDEAMHELPALQALEALGKDYFAEQHLYDLLSPADLVKRIAKPEDPIRDMAQQCVYAIAEIQRRNMKNGKPGVSGDEMNTLRTYVGKLVAYLRNVPNVDIWRASKAAVDEFNRNGALRV